ANFPGNAEVCDGQDNDCEGTPDFTTTDDDGGGETSDADSDTSLDCADCDDADAANFPGNAEVCDGQDNDCLSGADFTTTDDDGGSEADSDSDTSLDCADCDDGDAANYPGNVEVCDGQDNDCLSGADFTTTDDDGGTELSDSDSDTSLDCADCDDADAANFPGNAEICDGRDNDCEGTPDFTTTDDDGGGETNDADSDTSLDCADCDDLDPNNFPGNTDYCDTVDNDCDGLADEGNIDSSGYCDSCECTTWWVLSDSGGDGWTPVGGRVVLEVEGSFYGEAAMPNGFSSWNVYGCIANGSQFSWQYFPGADANEHSYYVSSADGAYYYGSTYNPDASSSGYPPDTVEHEGYALCGAPCPLDDVLEPNSSSSEAVVIGDGTYSDLTSCPVDPDWYQLSLAAGDWLQVDASFDHDASNIQLRLYRDPASTPIANSLTYTDDERLLYKVEETDTYYLKVYQYGDTDSERGGSYDMTVATLDAPCSPSDLSLILEDTQRNGWDGASLDTFDGSGVALGSYALDFGVQLQAVCISDPGCIELDYNGGAADSTNEFSLWNTSYQLVYESGLGPDTSSSYFYPTGCDAN
ncbi:MAG: hypothetical protein CL928_12970, partial [Deltaproteobacteria bacterium]|nr:hypothetical protein [Deltaproteobacteria bacterium]